MPEQHIDSDPQNIRHSDEMQDIITAVPTRLIQWGMTLFLCVLVMILSLSALIHYPDIVKTSLIINVSNSPKSEGFFGEMVISQNIIGKVHIGQNVLIKLNDYPSEQYGILKGEIKSITNNADKRGSFMAEVAINNNKVKNNDPIKLKSGMLAEAEIATQDATILQRIGRNIFKSIKNK